MLKYYKVRNAIALLTLTIANNSCGGGFGDYIDNLGDGYYFESEGVEYNSIFRGESTGWAAYSVDTCLLAVNIKILNYDKEYIYIAKERIKTASDFEFAADRLQYSDQQLDSFKVSERAKKCAPCYYIIEKAGGVVSRPMTKADYLSAKSRL